MRLDELYIEGFGIFQDYKIDKLNPGLNVIVGLNESGKSTIHTFIKRVLFGFPRGRFGGNPYPPLRGGNHGGRLVVFSKDEERYVVERYSGKSVALRKPDGKDGGEAELSDLLGHVINENIYKNIYAVGLTELQDFDTLNGDEVRERLYSAGTGVGAYSLSEILKDLDKEAEKLFLPSGKNPEINILFRDLKDIDKNIRELKGDINAYDELHHNLMEVNGKIKEISGVQSSSNTELDYLKNLINAWDDWIKLEESKRLLSEIPKVESFPRKGIELLETHLDRIKRDSERTSEESEKLEKIKIKKSSIEIDKDVLDNSDKIFDILSGQDKYESASGDLKKEREILEREKDELQYQLKEIGPEWNDEQFSNFDTSIPSKEEVRKKRDVLHEVASQISETGKDAQKVQNDIVEINVEIEEIDKELKGHSTKLPDVKNLEEQKQALRNLRAKYPILKGKEADLRYLQQNEEFISLMSPAPQSKSVGLTNWPAYFFVTTGIVALVISTIGNALGVGIIIFVLLSIAAFLYIYLAKHQVSSKGKLDSKETNDLSKKSENLSDQKGDLKLELEKLKDDMLVSAKVCEFSEIPEPGPLEKRDSELAAISEKVQNLSDLKNDKEKFNGKKKKLEEEEKKLLKKLKELKKTEEDNKNEWNGWLSGQKLDPRLSPDGVLEVFSALGTCIEKKKSIKSLSSRINRMSKRIKEYEEKIISILKDCNRSIDKDNLKTLSEVEKLARDLNQAKEEFNKLRELEVEEKSLDLSLKNLDNKIQEERDALSQLLVKGASDTEEDFRNKAKNWEESDRLGKEIVQAKQNIKRLGGEGEAYSKFISALQESELDDLKNQATSLSERLEKIEEDLSKLHINVGETQNEIRKIEQRGEGSSLRMEREGKIEKLKKKSEDWSAIALAKTIFRKGIEKYERERQPGVITESQSFFSKMTVDRYKRIYAPLDERNTIRVEDQDGREKDILELSRATAEQLYLSLRFGFIREFGKRAESLPIIFDDIFVNFDPERAQTACEAINELKKTNQILFFTCHPGTVSLLSETIPDSKIIEI